MTVLCNVWYLQRLSITCSLICNNLFTDDVEHRKRLRQKKVRQEKRWSKKIQEEERRRLGITPGMKIVKSAFCPQIVSENRPMSPTAKSDSSEQSLPSISSPIGSPLGKNITVSKCIVYRIRHNFYCCLINAQFDRDY